MPFAFIDGFDDYPADLNAQGVGLSSTWVAASDRGSLVAGRFGNRAFRIRFNRGTYRGIPSTTQVTFGIAVRQAAIHNNIGAGQPFLSFGSTNNNTQFSVGCDDLGNIKVTRTDFSNPLAMGEKRVLPNTWHYIELELVLSDTAGRVKLSIDGDEQFNLLNVDTKAHADADIGRVWLHANGTFATTEGIVEFDDSYCKYNEAAMIGECRAQLLSMTADDVVQWSRLSGANNFSMISEPQIDSDVTYNYSNIIGQKDVFTMADLTGNPTTIHALQLSIAAKKDDAGTRTLKHVVQFGGGEYLGAEQYQTTDYTWQRIILTENPVAAVPWSKADLNALKVGYQLTL